MKTFCPLPWRFLATSPSGSIRLCCMATPQNGLAKRKDGKTFQLRDSLTESWNADLFLQVREAMKKGEWHPACGSCQKIEEKGGVSDRQGWLARYPELDPENLPVVMDPSQIDRMDLRLGNKCNLKCRMCSPYSSSSWYQDWAQLGEFEAPFPEEAKNRLNSNWQDSEEVWKQLYSTTENLKEVYFAGGEPLLVKAHHAFLQHLIAKGKASEVILRYTTNGTLFDSELVQLWSHFKKVKLRISVDGIGALNDYIRFPSQWTQIEKNIERYLSLPFPAEIVAQCAVQIYNVMEVPRIVDFFAQKKIEVFLDYVRYPERLSLSVLPAPLAKRARELLQAMPSHPRKEFLINSLDSSQAHLWGSFLEFSAKLDSIRSQKLQEIVPELFTN